MSREARNAIKIEGWRLSRVPVDPTEIILQGDMLAWNGSLHQATKLSGTSGGQFIGVADHTNPELSFGVITSDIQSARQNVVQQGLVEMDIEETVTIYPYDLLTCGTDAQKVKKTGATTNNQVGWVDTSYGSAGKAVTSGDRILLWLTVPAAFRAFS